MNKAVRSRLFLQYKQLTHGGNYWRDQYLLEYWDQCVQPVVYRNSLYHGYKLLRQARRLVLADTGSQDAVWRPIDDLGTQLMINVARDYLTVKFLSRGQDNDMEMSSWLKENCHSPFVSSISDRFTIPHHLARTAPRYQGINFDAIVYATTGTDLRRKSSICEQLEASAVPLSMDRRERYIQQVVQAVAELHRVGVVHGDLHPGNVALPPPTRDDIELVLAKPPREYNVIREDGELTPVHLPQRVIEPDDIGFGDGHIKLIDFGYAFRPTDGAAYSRDVFARGTPPPPELLGIGKTTSQPFKAESWYLGQLIYFVLVDGWPIFERHLGYNDEDLREEYDYRLADLENGQDELINKLPEDLRLHFAPFLMALLDRDPDKRLLIEHLNKDERFMRKVNLTC